MDEGQQKPRSVAIFGAGVAGLSAAHELVRRGYKVAVYESTSESGGFFRSARDPKNDEMPSEYSWHGMGPWYHNVFDIMKQIPFDAEGSVFDKALSRPIDFGIFPDRGHGEFFDESLGSLLKMFQMSKLEFVRWSWLLFKVWTSHHRTERSYARINAALSWKDILKDRAYRTWSASFGPWIGADWTNASLHHAGQFVRKQFIGRSAHHHPADEEGPSWTHLTGDGWLLLRGPSSELWFDKWVAALSKRSRRRIALDGYRLRGHRPWTRAPITGGPLHKSAVHRRGDGADLSLRVARRAGERSQWWTRIERVFGPAGRGLARVEIFAGGHRVETAKVGDDDEHATASSNSDNPGRESDARRRAHEDGR